MRGGLPSRCSMRVLEEPEAMGDHVCGLTKAGAVTVDGTVGGVG